MRPDNKQILVVGGANGIGLVTVRNLVKEGYGLTVWDRDEAALARLDVRAEIKRLVNIRDRSAVVREIDALRSQGTVFHAVVVTAGVHSTAPVELIPDAMLDRVMDINFVAHAKLARDIIPLMAKNGRIVGVSSIAATIGIPMSAVYSASKAALELFYETMATELRSRSIFAVIVNPGNVNTGFNETGNELPPGTSADLVAKHCQVVNKIHSRNGMPPEVVANVICAAVRVAVPKFYYIVGGNAKRAALAKRILGHDGALFLLRRHFGFQ